MLKQITVDNFGWGWVLFTFICMCCWVHIVVSFLYLDLYVLGNGLSMSVIVHAKKALCVLNHIRVKGEVGVVEHVWALCFLCCPFCGLTTFVSHFCCLCFTFFLIILFCMLRASLSSPAKRADF